MLEFTHIVTAPLLEDFSKTKQSEGVIPELVWKLITNSATTNLSVCRVPYGDSIGLPGFDGLVSTPNGYKHYLPKGTSYWEIGTGGKPGNKATSDYKKRTLDEDTKLSAEVLAESAYVFLTPLSKAWSITAQQRWSGKRKSDGWKEIKIIDGIVLADWLREFPAIAKWLLKKIGLVQSTIGFSTIAEHWELIPQSSNPDDPKLPPELFIIGRDKVCEEISKLFRGEINQLFVAIESTEDLEDLVSAYVESLNPELGIQLTDKCLFVNNAEAWQELIQLKSPHIFVASPNLSIHTNNDLHMAAIKNGHRVIIPIAGTGNNDRGDILSIRSPRKSQIENVLIEGGFSHDRANELANKGGLSPLKRYLRGLESMPNYATWDNVGLLSLLNLLGQFNSENASDNQIVENLVGKPKSVWFDEAISLTRKQDSPLEYFAGKWKLNSRVEAWQVLGPRITKENLDKFSDIAIEVLGAEHPKFSLPRDKLRTAHFYGVDLDHSESIREGIAETVALLGAHSKALMNLYGVSGEYYAHKIVSNLLGDADWKRWASLNIYLPNLAEASPTAFLDAVDSTLGAEPSPFLNLFALEEAGIFGGNYISGLLWALETLAWSPDYLLLATERLGELASLDPGGSWGNRPKNSLGEIFMPWHYQTTANQEKRLAAINRLEKISPKVYRELINRLLPTPHGTASGTRKPAWRDFCSNSSSKVITNGEYFSQIEIYTDLAIELSKHDFDLLLNIVGKFGHLPVKQTESLLNHLRSSAIQKLNSAQRTDLWSKITSLTNNHRTHIEQEWAMDLDLIEKIESILPTLVDDEALQNDKRLFANDDFRLQEFDEQYAETFPSLQLRRVSKVSALLESKSPEDIKIFASSCEAPYKVGFALGALIRTDLDSEFLPADKPSDKTLERIRAGYLSGRFWYRGADWEWVDTVTSAFESENNIIDLLIDLEFDQNAWSRIEKLSDSTQDLYWKKCNADVWRLDETSLLYVLNKFSSYKRYSAGIACLYAMVHKSIVIPIDQAKNILLHSNPTEEDVKTQFDSHYLLSILKALQSSAGDLDSEAMLSIEWNYLSILGKIEDAHPIFLEQKLADEPEFYLEIISLVFRADGDSTETPQTEVQKLAAKNAYKLLSDWKTVPGTTKDGKFIPEKFKEWMAETKKLAKAAGRFQIALDQLGRTLCNSPSDPSGLWIHRVIAEVLDERTSSDMRNGLNRGFFGQRGVFTFTNGKGEMNLANYYIEKANAVENEFPRLAKSIRELSDDYKRDSMSQAGRDGFRS